MFRDLWPVEKGAAVRQTRRRYGRGNAVWLGAAAWAATLGLLLTSFAAAQEATPPEDDAPAEVAAPRKTAGIAWNPKTTPEEIKAVKNKELTEFTPATKLPSLNPKAEADIERHIKNAVYSLTVEQELDNFADIRQRKIIDPIEGPQTTDAARSFMLDVTMKTCSELLFNDTQPANVQYNLVLLIAQLNSKPADLSARPAKAPVPYLPASKPLLQVAQTASFPIYCRIMAVHGLDRILRDGDVDAVTRSDLGRDLSKLLDEEIDRPIGAQWYYLRVCRALGVCGRLYDTAGSSTIIDSLLRTIASQKREWVVRSGAARAISQLPFEQSTNVELVNHEIGKLCLQLSEAYNASANKKDSQWRWSFSTIYLAYRSATEIDQKQRHWGLMFQTAQRGKPQVEALYKIMLPILKGMIESDAGRPIPDAQIKALADWLAKNKPADRKATPASPELTEAAPSADPAAPMSSTAEPQRKPVATGS
jgi:hypothetical protein